MMPVLKNPRHERFAQELAKGVVNEHAYEAAGFKRNRHNAAALARTEHVKARVSELLADRERRETATRERAIEKAGISKAWVIERLRENAERAMQVEAVTDREGRETGEFRYEGSVANRALELLGKELGMFIDRREQGAPGEFEKLEDSVLVERVIAELVASGVPEDKARLFAEAKRGPGKTE